MVRKQNILGVGQIICCPSEGGIAQCPKYTNANNIDPQMPYVGAIHRQASVRCVNKA